MVRDGRIRVPGGRERRSAHSQKHHRVHLLEANDANYLYFDHMHILFALPNPCLLAIPAPLLSRTYLVGGLQTPHAHAQVPISA